MIPVTFFGYIDPGTGSLFLQAIIGVVLGGIVVFRGFIARIFDKLRTVIFRRSVETENEEE